MTSGMPAGWNTWSCGYCRGKGFLPQDVDWDAWLAASHGYGKCVQHPGFMDGGGI